MASHGVKWVNLHPEALGTLYTRHRETVLAAREMLRLARSRPPLAATAEQDVAVYWWHDDSGRDRLSDNSEMGLRTAVQIAGLQPVLYGY